MIIISIIKNKNDNELKKILYLLFTCVIIMVTSAILSYESQKIISLKN